MKENELLTRKELAEFLRISIATLQTMMKNREIPFYKINKRIIFKKSDIDEWLKQRKIEIQTK